MTRCVSNELAYRVKECEAFYQIGSLGRGCECGRDATHIDANNYSIISHSIKSSPDKWMIAEYSNLARRVAVLYDGGWFFYDPNTGVCDHSIGVVDAGIQAVAEQGVFEVLFDEASFEFRIYDVCVLNGKSVRKFPYVERIGLISGGEWDDYRFAQLKDLKSLSKPDIDSLVEQANSAHKGRIMLLSKTSACEFYSGGDVLQWKKPSILPGQAILMCVHGELKALASYESCLMEPVGKCNPGPTHSHTGPESGRNRCYIYKKDKRPHNWTAIREAKRAEQIYTVQDVVQVQEEPKYIVTSQMMKSLLNIMAPPALPKKIM
jgi:hypothetical protein